MSTGTREPVDLLLHGGAIHTVDAEDRVVSALAARDGAIVAVGGPELRERFAASEEVDLAGRAVLPGFIDTHMHVRGDAPWHIDLADARSIAEIQDRIRAKAATLDPGHWVTGFGWAEDQFAEQRLPHRADLDVAAPGNPVVLTRAGAHSVVANSLALRAAGLHAESPDPPGGVLDRDPDGELSGIVREPRDVFMAVLPVARPEQTRDNFVARLRGLFRLGITSIVNASDTPDHYPEWEHVYALHPGALPRAAVQMLWQGPEAMAAFGRRTGDGDASLRVGAVKVFADGGFTGPAAYTSRPYRGHGDFRGKMNLSLEDLQRVIDEAHDAGWQLAIHAIGDAAITHTVDAMARTLTRAPRADHRHFLNHFTIIPERSVMETMAAHGIAISQQPNFLYTLEARYVDLLEGEALERNNPLRTPMDLGIHAAISSDSLPLGPFLGIYVAVTRRGPSGRAFAPDEAITVAEAIRGYTRDAAVLTFEEERKGSLEPGKLADLVVLDRDPYAIEPETLRDVRVLETYLGGRRVFAAEEAAAP